MSDNQPLSHDEVVKRSFSGAANSLVIRTITAILKFARTVLLARLLIPSEFGVVGLALVYVQFLDTIGTFGLNMQLVRSEKLDDEIVSTHFWLRMGLQSIMVLVTFAIASTFKFFYPDRPLLSTVMIVLGFIWFLQASYSTQEATLAHYVNFERLNYLDLLSSTLTLIVAPILAWFGWGIWSLVAGIYLLGSVTLFCGLWFYRTPWRPSWMFNVELAKKYLHFGWTVVIGKQLNYGLDQFDDFWIGSTLGDRALGIYDKAFQFARYPRQVIAEPLSGVFFSTYSKFQDNHELLSKSFFISNSFILRLNGLFSLILFVIAPEFVGLLLGERWLPMVVTFRLMVVYSFLDPLILSAGNLLIAVGQPKLQTINRLIQLIIFIPLVIVFARYGGIEGVGVAADLMLVVGVFGLLRAARKFVTYSPWKMFFAPVVGLLLGGSAAFAFQYYFDFSNQWVFFFAKSLIAAIMYVVALFTLEIKSYRSMTKELRTILPPQYSKILSKFI